MQILKQMEREKISVRFAELRPLAATIPVYLAAQAGVAETPSLATAIEDELGMAGLDTESLLVEFGTDYRVEMLAFDFTGFISPEPGTAGAWIILLPLLAVLWGGAWLDKLLAALLCWPVSQARARGIWALSTLPTWFSIPTRPLADVLTVGDFVAAAAVGRFVKRARIHLVLTTTIG